MSEQDPHKSLQEFDERLRRLREEVDPAPGPSAVNQPMAGLGIAWTITAHLVTGLAMGAGIGYLLDDWWGSRPAMMIVFFFLGGAAGIRNAIRTAQTLDRTAAAAPARSRHKGKSPVPPEPGRKENESRHRG